MVAFFKFPKLPRDVTGIIKITEQIAADGLERRLSSPFQQSSLNKSAPQGKGHKKFGSRQKSKDQSGGETSNKEDK